MKTTKTIKSILVTNNKSSQKYTSKTPFGLTWKIKHKYIHILDITDKIDKNIITEKLALLDKNYSIIDIEYNTQQNIQNIDLKQV